MEAANSTSFWDKSSKRKFKEERYIMRKKSLFIALLMLITGTAVHAQKFALIDMEYILKNIPAYQSATEEIGKSTEQWQAEIDKLAKEAKTLYEEYQSVGTKLTDEQRTQKEEEIVAKEKSAAELRRKYFGPEGELYKKQQSLIRPIQDDIYEAVKSIATRKGYAVVTDRASATSIIFASPSIDISDEVLAQLGYSN